MSLHRSLTIKGVGKGHRNVLKRFERIIKLQEAEKWTEENGVFKLPKVKSIKLK
ncbi:small basic protein [bacterium]|nr:small basic protein [bacterium]